MAVPRRSAFSDCDQPMISRPSSSDQTSPAVTLVQPSRPRRPRRVARLFRFVCRALPVFSPSCGRLHPPSCKLLSGPSFSSGFSIRSGRSTVAAARLVTGTLFGPRRGRVSLSVQENPRCLPSIVVELALQTHALLREMSSGMVRIALECEKRPPGMGSSHSSRLLDEKLWTVFCNGKRTGYGVRRETTDDDLTIMETLQPVSMGAGVLPARAEVEGPDGEVAYVRSSFEHVVSSRDSETLYMVTPDGDNGPELSIFFVRI